MSRTTVLLFAVALTASSSASAGLIAHWSADGNADDSVAGRNGTLVNGATYGAGKFGQAFLLDGTDDYVSVPDDSVWTFTSDFTISLWANYDTLEAGSFRNRMIGHDDGPGEEAKWFFNLESDGTLHFHQNGSIAEGYGVGGVDLTHAGTFATAPGEWIHLAVKRTGSLYSFYANGQLLGSMTNFIPIPNSVAPLTIGQAEDNRFFDGRLDEIRIYDEALSDTEILFLFSPAAPEPSTVALIALGVLSLIAVRKRR